MESHREISDIEFEEAFAAGSFSNPFTHEAHLRLAYIHLKKYGRDRAIENIELQLSAYVEGQGANDKYSTTLTVAAIEIVNHFLKKTKADNFEDFLSEYPRLKENLFDLVKSHYSEDVLNSPESRKVCFKPDLLDF